MESQNHSIAYGKVVHVTSHAPDPAVLVICEHASRRIPKALNYLGLDEEALLSHAAWDPGALGVAQAVSEQMSAILVQSDVSRLVYDCNRPRGEPSAFPAKSEIYDIPGNRDLSQTQRIERYEQVYLPFENAISKALVNNKKLKCLVTIHSFTPVYHGVSREVELGILHGQDDRLAKAMMADVPSHLSYVSRLNEPYAPKDGVAHTLDFHGVANGLLNVMIEVRNDLIQTPDAQVKIARALVPWINDAISVCEKKKGQGE